MLLLVSMGATEGQEEKPAADPMIGKEAPELEISEWVGDAYTLKDLRGKVVLLEFFQML